jgi:hypothetical protein
MPILSDVVVIRCIVVLNRSINSKWAIFGLLSLLHPVSDITSIFAFYAHHSVHRESILKKFQQDDTFVQYFYFLQAVLHVSGGTFTHHQEFKLYLQHLVLTNSV